MSNGQPQLLMAGPPGTGKTTFLALLWLAVLWGRTSGMKLADFQDDREYLNLIAGRLQSCDPAVHTELSEDRELKLSLILGGDEEPVALRIPDLSGETWRDATIERHWPLRVDEHVTNSHGLLLFMHASDFDAGATIGQVNEMIDILGLDPTDAKKETVRLEGDADVKSGEESVSDGNRKPAHDPPTQVALVDALQLICQQRGRRPAFVSIVISAWDRVAKGLTPEKFAAKNLPLLVQYLHANDDWLKVRIFGVSAQGGDFGDGATRELLAKTESVERAIVHGPGGDDVGVHEIVVWALGRS